MPDTPVLDSSASTTAVDAPSAPAPATDSTPAGDTARESSSAGRTGPSYQERTDALRGKAREHYRLTGNLDEAERLSVRKKSDASAESSPATEPGADNAQTEAASGTAEQRGTRQDRDWRATRQRLADLERQNTEFKAKLDVYERAGNRPSAPVETPQPAPQAQPQAQDLRPEFPDIEAFTDPKKYQAAVKDWQKKDSEWMQRQFDKRITTEKAQQTQEKAVSEWNTQLENARKVHKDFETVAFNKDVPISYATLSVIQSLNDGALRSYALGKDLKLAGEIAQLTHIPGENKFKTFPEFMRWVNSDPRIAMAYGEKLALARVEIQKLQVATSKAPQTPETKTPLKEVLRRQPRPSAEVTVDDNAQPVADPASQALKNGDFEAYKRIKNEEDRRRMARR
jgi:hypothetical protein